MYPFEKYQYSISTCRKTGKRQIRAISTYAGKPVVGVATCSTDDTFNEENGKRLAALRCAKKIAEKRMTRAAQKRTEAYKAYIAADKRLDDTAKYCYDARQEYDEISEVLDNLLKEI